MPTEITKRFQKMYKDTGVDTFRSIAEAADKNPVMTEQDAWSLNLFLSEFAVYESTNGHGIQRRQDIGNYIEKSRGSYLFPVLEELKIPERLKRIDEMVGNK